MYRNLKSKTIRNIILLTVFGLFITGILLNKATPTTSRNTKLLTNNQLVSPVTTNTHTAKEQIPKSLQEAVTKAHYKAEKTNEKLVATNIANNMKAEFDETGLSLRSTSKNADWQSGWRLKSIGYGATQTEIASGELISKDQRIEISREEANLVEWFENRPSGLEHGYTLAKRPGKTDSPETLRLVMEVTGDLKAVANYNGQALKLKDRTGKEVLQYRKLKVWDADNNEQIARMQVSDNKVLLDVEETDAKYPLTIDPTFTESKKLTASDGAAGDRFGRSLAISGDTVVLGAFGDDDNGTDSGSAYILERNEGGADNWGEVAKLTASDGTANDGFGYSVSVFVDTVIVSAFIDDDNGTNSGSAYIFGRNEGGANNWGEVAKLTPIDGASGDQFGYSVSISDDTVIVGAYLDNSQKGSSYIFERNEGGTDNWGEVTKLVASDGVAGDEFGFSVSISDDTAVVSAWLDDNGNGANAGSGYIYERNEGGANNWGEITKLTTSDGAFDDRLGYSAFISSDRVVIGAYRDDPFGSESGSAYIFDKDEGGANNWGEVTKLIASDGAAGDQFGFGVAVLGDTVLIGARRDDNKGSAYIYKRNEGGANNWGEASKLIASDGIPGFGNAGPNFGLSLALSSNTAIVSSSTDDSVGADAGSAYVFPLATDPDFTQTDKLLAPDGTASDGFGYSVAIDGNTAAVGAVFDVISGTNRGSVYIFVKSGGIWAFQQKLYALDGGGNNNFGGSVDISGDTLIVGSGHDNQNGTFAGAAYVYVRSGMTWNLEQKLLPSTPGGFAQFGVTVAIDGNTAVAGANGNGSGAAYVFVRSGTIWIEEQKITGSATSFGENFGVKVAISGDSIIVGAYYDDITGVAHCGGAQPCPGQRGTAYVFTRSGTTWIEEQILFASDGGTSDFFGLGLAISGNTAIVGSFLGDIGGNANQGAAYVYTRSGTTWTEVKKIIASDGAAGDKLGSSIAIEGDKVVIGAYWDDISSNINQGSAYIFERNKGGTNNWGEFNKLIASDGAGGDEFGFKEIGFTGGTIIVGAHMDDDNGSNSGSAYIFSNGVETTQASALSVTAASGDFDGATTLSATLTNSTDNSPLSGKAVSFTLNGSPVGSAVTDATGEAVLPGISLTGISVGNYPTGVESDFSGDMDFEASDGNNSLTVNTAHQTINFAALANKTYGDGTFGVSATASSGLMVSFTASGDCSVAGTIVTITGAGSCTITASQAGNGNYNAAPDVDQTFSIGQATISVTPDTQTITYGDANPTFTFSYSGFVNGEGSTVIGIEPTCSVTGAPTDAGDYPITCSGGTDDNYSFNYGAATLTIEKADQTITFSTLADKTYGDVPFNLTATSTSGLAVSYASAGDCSVTGSTVTITGAGSCTITASQVGDGNYNPASDKDQSFTISKADQTITFVALADKTFGDVPFNLSATSTSGLTVSYAAAGDCSVVGPTVTITGAGSCTITASQAGDDDHNAATDVDQNFTIDQADQTIAFGALADKTYGDGTFGVSATASSGLMVSFTASGNCTVVGTAVTITGAGSCTISASQAGNDDYNAATDADQTFLINKAVLTVSADNQQIIVGSPDPTYTFSYSGFVNGENSGVIDTAPTCEVTGPHSGVGSYTITCSGGVDNNYSFNYETATLMVIYNFNGFFNPIDNFDINNVKAGRGIPVKFSLNGDFGLNIIEVGYPVSYEIPCSGSGDDGDEIPTVTAGNSSLSYDETSDQYNYVWKTDKSWSGTCRRLVVKLIDGTFHTADFKFK